MYFKDLEAMTVFYENRSLTEGEALMVFLSDASDSLYKPMTAFFHQHEYPFFGGIFPGLLFDGKFYATGMIVLPIRVLFRSLVYPFMMKKYEGDLHDKTTFVIADGLSPDFKNMTETLYEKLGPLPTYVGGGAGYGDREHRPCIFDEKGIYEDCMIAAVIDHRSEVTYRHGWERLVGPYHVTASVDNLLAKIDDKAAFHVYKNILEAEVNLVIDKDSIKMLAASYPFGIAKEGMVDVVRDPIAVDEDEGILCVASVPEGSQIYILKGNCEVLLAGAAALAEACVERTEGDYTPVLFDCITRALFMEDRFTEEVETIQDKLTYPLMGALSIGEILSVEDSRLQLHNKSAVLANIIH